MYIFFVEGAQWCFDIRVFIMTREDYITKIRDHSGVVQMIV